MRHTFVFTRLSCLAALGVLACGSSAPAPAQFSAGCLHYAKFLTGGQCGYPALPALEVARVTPRWAQHCEEVVAMPDSLVSADAIDKCLTVSEAGGCWSANPTDACLFLNGTLPAGAGCNVRGVQCQSGLCFGVVAQDPCGKCLPLVTLGQTCDQQRATNVCVAQSTCLPTATSAVCTTLGPAGTTCLQSSDCASGLFCDPATQTCSAPLAAGTPCADPFGCTYPLVCNLNANSGATCQATGGPGSQCLTDEFCTRPLGCSAANQTCGVVSWQAAGQPCDGDLIRCLVGGCPMTSAPVCPTVIKDGSDCTAGDDSQTCDSGAVCFGGKCVLGSSVVCP